MQPPIKEQHRVCVGISPRRKLCVPNWLERTTYTVNIRLFIWKFVVILSNNQLTAEGQNLNYRRTAGFKDTKDLFRYFINLGNLTIDYLESIRMLHRD